jgi:hypothetical protein
MSVIMSALKFVLLQGNVRVSMSAYPYCKFDSSVIAATPPYLPKVSQDVQHLQYVSKLEKNEILK